MTSQGLSVLDLVPLTTSDFTYNKRRYSDTVTPSIHKAAQGACPTTPRGFWQVSFIGPRIAAGPRSGRRSLTKLADGVWRFSSVDPNNRPYSEDGETVSVPGEVLETRLHKFLDHKHPSRPLQPNGFRFSRPLGQTLQSDPDLATRISEVFGEYDSLIFLPSAFNGQVDEGDISSLTWTGRTYAGNGNALRAGSDVEMQDVNTRHARVMHESPDAKRISIACQTDRTVIEISSDSDSDASELPPDGREQLTATIHSSDMVIIDLVTSGEESDASSEKVDAVRQLQTSNVPGRIRKRINLIPDSESEEDDAMTGVSKIPNPSARPDIIELSSSEDDTAATARGSGPKNALYIETDSDSDEDQSVHQERQRHMTRAATALKVPASSHPSDSDYEDAPEGPSDSE